MAFSVTGIDHACVIVTDFQQARDYYTGVLGMEEIAKPQSVKVAVLWFRFGDEMLHVLPADAPDSVNKRHIALHVDDVDAAREHIRSHGYAVEEGSVIPGADRFYTRDPFGNRLEFIRWSESYVPGS